MAWLDLLWAYLLVFLLAATPFVELIVIIPIGTFVGLELLPVTILALAGNLLTVIIVILFIDQIKTWISRRKKKNAESQESKRFVRGRRFWNRFGLPGLALIGPALVGSHLTAFMSLSLGGSKAKTTYWIVVSLVAWTVLTTLLTYLGVDFLNIETGENSWINRLFSN